LAEKTQYAGIANSLTGGTLAASSPKLRRKNFIFMRKKSISRTLLVSLIFAALAIVPIFHFIFITYDGGLLYLINKIIFNDDLVKQTMANWIANFSLSIVFLTLFYKSKSKITETVYSILFLIFSFCFIYFLVYFSNVQEMKPYFLLSLIVSMISGLILNITLIVKERASR